MSDAITYIPPPRRGLAWLAWIVILLVIGFEVFGAQLIHLIRTGNIGNVKAGRPRKSQDAGEERIDLPTELQVRYLVGLEQTFPESSKTLMDQARSLNTGPIEQRLPYLVLVGDVEGPGQALDEIGKLREQLKEQGQEPNADQQALLDALERLYKDRRDKTETLTAADRKLLLRRLGWTGKLALTPPDDPDQEARREVIHPAKRLFFTLIGVFAAGALAGLVGFVGLVLWIVFFLMGKLRRGLPPPTRHGGIYAEAFAVYMIVFLGLSIAHQLLHIPGPELLLSAAAMLLSLAAGLVWPVLRGIPWQQVRQEVGLKLNRPRWLELLIGLGGYALVIPIIAIGIIVSSFLIQYERRLQVGPDPERHFAPVEEPSHPIVEWLQNPNWMLLAQVMVIVCVLAPLVEETMFRGVLYRHLRDATARLGRTGSFLVSGVIVSFIFAVIHPQGVLAVPALMAVALGLTLLREWRGSLLPSMMVHGIHNGLTTFVLVQALRG